MKKHYLLLPILAILMAVSTNLQAQVIYVKQNATGANNGSSWQNAYTDLSQALDNATAGQIWVAAGKYLPGGNNPVETDNFAITAPISLYGGFAGTETDLTQRNPSLNPTTLSGDLNGNDVSMLYDTTLSLDNTLHVIYVDSLIGGTVRIDGFNIEHGTTDNDNTQPVFFWRGGGIFALSPIQVYNCVLSGNYARSGAAIFLSEDCGGSLFRDCTFTRNKGGNQSAGIFAEMLTGLTIKQCIFEENETQRGTIYPFRCTDVLVDSCSFASNHNMGGFGGAMFIWNNVNFTLSNSFFGLNTAGNAGAIFINGTELPGIGTDNFKILNCVFGNNATTDFGGGAIYNSGAESTIKGCTFLYNEANNGAHLFQTSDGFDAVLEDCKFLNAASSGWGGAITCYGRNSNFHIKNCEFDGNVATNLGGAANNGFGATATYEDCIFTNNQSSSSAGGALALQNDSTTVIVLNCSFTSNTASSSGGAIFSGATESSSIVVVDHCEFINNTTGATGGAIYIGEGGDDDISSLTLSNSVFGFNIAATQGGAVNLGDTDADITSCLFFQNSANGTGTGGAISNNASDSNSVVVRLMNCTFAQNYGELAAGMANWTGATDAFSETTMQNCIFWQEDATNYAVEDGTPELLSNGGNLSDDSSLEAYLTHPKDKHSEEASFVEPDDYDYHLTDNSVGVDDGVAEGAPDFDLEGNPRHFIIDMGAYENQTSVGTKENLLANNGLLALSPNPTWANTTTLRLENDWQGLLQIQVTNSLGSTVWTANAQKTGKALQYTLPLDFGRGVYQVQVSNGHEMVVERMIRL